MDWSEIAAFARRRRLLILLTVLATAAAGVMAVTRVPPEYTAQGEVLLLPPSTVVGDSGNPFLSLDGLTPIGDVVATSLSSATRVQELESQGATAEYVVARDTQSPAPMLLVEVTGTSADETMRTLGLVMDSLRPGLERVQRDVGVPTGAYVKLLDVTRSDKPDISLKAPIRAVIVVTGGVFVFLLGLIVIYDAIRRSKGSQVSDDGGEDEEADAPGGDASPKAGTPGMSDAPGAEGALEDPVGFEATARVQLVPVSLDADPREGEEPLGPPAEAAPNGHPPVKANRWPAPKRKASTSTRSG